MSISICSRFSSWKVLKLMRRHAVMELRDISRHRATGIPGRHGRTTGRGAHWHAGLLPAMESLSLSIRASKSRR